jgi:N-acetyl-beta-hexosaminidase
LETTLAVQKKAEAYEIVIDESGIEIIYADYSGYIYALETLAQLYSNGRLPHVYIKD